MLHGCPPFNVERTYCTLLQLRISWPLTLCFTHSPFALQILGIPNQVVWAGDRSRSSACTKLRANPRPINCNVIPQKDTVIPSIAQTRYPLNSQVLAIFFPSATITMPHHPALLIDILHSMVGYRFHCIS